MITFAFKSSCVFLIAALASASHACAQSYPQFGPEKKVTITGLTFDAMEPFLSPNGNTLFFNSLNSGGNTNLYFASRVNDSVFTFQGLLGGTYNPAPNHLDGVASLDQNGEFYWVSNRNYPLQMENLHKGLYNNGTVTSLKRVYGNFNVYSFNNPMGWLIMDAGISQQGNLLLYCNALFDFSNSTCSGLPCKAKLGMASKVNDSTFTKLSNSDGLFSQINDSNYLVYAPALSADGLELYFTRILKSSFNSEICVSVRAHATDTFSLPALLYSNNGFVPEAPTLSANKQIIYYHQKDAGGTFRIFLRYRTGTTGLSTSEEDEEVSLYPNPAADKVTIRLQTPHIACQLKLYSLQALVLIDKPYSAELDLTGLSRGLYFLELSTGTRRILKKLIKD